MVIDEKPPVVVITFRLPSIGWLFARYYCSALQLSYKSVQHSLNTAISNPGSSWRVP
jgi:hypothetical protein